MQRRGNEVIEVASRRALPPGAGGLGAQARRVGKQLGDGDAVEGAGQVTLERIGDVQQALVAKAHHLDRDECFRDRPAAVLDVGRVTGELSGSARPDELSVPDHPGDDRRQPLLGLLAGKTPLKRLLGGGPHVN